MIQAIKANWKNSSGLTGPRIGADNVKNFSESKLESFGIQMLPD
jgi:hypothetical protein